MNQDIGRLEHDTNNYWEQLERLEKLIRASELKAGVIFSFHSLVLGLFVNHLPKIEFIFINNWFLIALAFVWMLTVIISIFYCFKCFRPDMELHYDKNVFFFKDAADSFGSPKEFSKELIRVCTTTASIVEELSYQIHAESVIIAKKFLCVKRALWFFGIGVVLIFSILIIWLIQMYL